MRRASIGSRGLPSPHGRSGTQRNRATIVRAVANLQRAAGPPTRLFIFLAVFILITLVFYFTIRHHDIELSFDQLSAFERQVHSLGNRTIYSIDVSRKDAVFSKLSNDDWAKISRKIDYVAFTYDDFNSLTAGTTSHDQLFGTLSQELEGIQPHGYGIALFSCGCLLHNIMFQHVSTRFDGMECAMLPGFVLDNDDVRWVETALQDDACLNRDRLLGQPWFYAQLPKLSKARSEYSLVRKHLSEKRHGDRLEADESVLKQRTA